MNSYYMVLSGFFAWFGVPLLTVLAIALVTIRTWTIPVKVLSIIAAVVMGTVLFVWLQWFHNPLPSDATLIKHFNEHRAEFEQLMKGARNYRVQVPHYAASAQGKELAEKLRIAYVGKGEPSWYPDPYSERVARVRGQYYGHSVKNVINRTPQEQLAYWKTNMPELFAGMTPVTEVWQLDSLKGVIEIRGIGSKEIGAGGITLSNRVRLGQGFHHIFKEYWHYPQPPRIGNGRILIPGYGWDDEPITQGQQRVLDSLDDYPPGWQPGECVLKRIDPHWFIAMCKGY